MWSSRYCYPIILKRSDVRPRRVHCLLPFFAKVFFLAGLSFVACEVTARLYAYWHFQYQRNETGQVSLLEDILQPSLSSGIRFQLKPFIRTRFAGDQNRPWSSVNPCTGNPCSK